ncbi:amidohydrolase [Sporomusa sphaeroides]|uniref:p-aminobenzoyl-glutamate hydrolase subunit A n=1 Tax=Sporomusa sphaeroides DSM 2875 TaxID=1337886 RepID=A0ABP2C7L8_9FIRM|nr:amidohydrolase [Sporomusa sphaeroides]OLS55255.1 p-aminobenzoyl-glutamate hydrolase subunit A [Sporomusa sphaeroides DSM 2875]CVK20346.1 p-aminobenzoyl-glutamate hydrolase subunit A [Sporomusa sphaeroides DSM 2875]
MGINFVALAEKLTEKTIARRRDFHKYPESAWTEFRTAAIVADTLSALGYQVLAGDEVIDAQAMMGVPAAAELERHAKRALAQGAKPQWVDKLQGGKTGVIGVLTCAKPGPTVGLRFDMDANDVVEAEDVSHRPFKEGFASVNRGAAHACGHDGHTAVGLAVAEILASVKEQLSGTIKLIFQPAEEGVRGARAMSVKGVVDDVDYFLGLHLGFNTKQTGQLACRIEGFLATTKLDAIFTGVPAHAGAAPEAGRNALLAAAAAALNLHAIARHSQGPTRINVGQLEAGTGRNVLPANAIIKLETRGTTSALNEYMFTESQRIIKAAADMYGVQVETREMGGAAGAENDLCLVERVEKVAAGLGIFKEIMPSCYFGASEDCTYFMERVQQRGGKAAYIMIGAALVAGHHDSRFDFDEAALTEAVALVSATAADLLQA